MGGENKPPAGLFKNFLVSAFGTGISRILGAIRDIVIAHYFGASKDWKNAREKLEYSLKIMAFFLIPASTFLLFFNIPIVSILFRHGNFTYTDSLVTAGILRLMVPFLLSLAGVNIIKKAYFALGERNTLLRVGGFGVALTALSGILLISEMGILGLAIALSFSTTVQLIIYIFILNKKIKNILRFQHLFLALSKMFLACVPPALILYFCSFLGNWQEGPNEFKNLLIFPGSLLLAFMAHLICAYFLKIPALNSLLKRFKSSQK